MLLIAGQALTRDGYDAARHPLSLLALGEHGWIQTANFLICGGFPAGTPADAGEVTWHGMLHNLAPVGMGLTLSVACLVFARRFVREGRPGWTTYSAAAPAAYFVLGFGALPAGDFRLMLAGGAVIWTWAAVLSLKFCATPAAGPDPQWPVTIPRPSPKKMGRAPPVTGGALPCNTSPAVSYSPTRFPMQYHRR